MCISVFQNKKKRTCVAGSLYILKLNSCNKVNHINENNYNNVGLKHDSYARFLNTKRYKCLKPPAISN